MLLQEYINLRTYRKNALCQTHYFVLTLLKEVAKRLTLTFEQLNVLSFDELLSGFKGDVNSKELAAIANGRLKGWGLLMWKGKIMTPTGISNVVKAMEQFRIIQPMQSSTKVINGRTACLGKVIGRVRIIQDIKELDKIKKGDILVTKMTTPDFVIAMRRCGGIVTDEGGVTCHAAIVSREFGIPCLIATHVATKQLNDNDVVELNATGGFARVLEAENIHTDISGISGKLLYSGKVTGEVKVVLDSVDFPKVKPGDIVVTNQTTPDFLSCLYRAGGLIVDEDSLTSHAALYAKTLKIPAIMGTRIAKSILFDGQKITLDAQKGRIKLVQ
jgi:phosphoenolpyruvate synthase/pyruvate phosphate dikinase